MSNVFKQSAFFLARYSGLNTCFRARTRSQFRVVTYHGVDGQDHPVVNFDRLQIQPDLFARQLESLARHFHVVSLPDALSGFLDGRGWPERGLAITFDDGYRNNLEVAAPILQRLGLPATFFVTAGFVEGRARPWWYDVREAVAAARVTEVLLPGEPVRDLRTVVARRACCQALEWAWSSLPENDRSVRLAHFQQALQVAPAELRYPFMTREEVQRLAGLGFDVQPHGDTHCSLRAEGAERVRQEVQASVAFITAITQRPPNCLAWPYGHMPATRTLAETALKQAGLAAAVSVATGFNGSATDPLALYRWDVHGGYTVAALEARLSGLTRWLRPSDKPYGS